MDGNKFRRIEAEVFVYVTKENLHDRGSPNYLQHLDGSWSVVGADGWPMPVEEYLEQLANVEAETAIVEVLDLIVIDVEPTYGREISCNSAAFERKQLEG